MPANELATQIQTFRQVMDDNFDVNLMPQTRSTLANMLTLDYNNRLSTSFEFAEYIRICIEKLRKMLRLKTITDDSFSCTITLFAEIIVSDNANDDNENILTKKQDLVVQNLIDQHFADVDPVLRVEIKAMLANILSNVGENKIDLIEYIHSEPKVFLKLVVNGQKLHKNQTDVENFVKTEITPLVIRNHNLNQQINNFKQATSMLATAVCACGVVAISLVSSVAALPLLMIPALIVSNKIAPLIGEKVGKIIVNNSSSLQGSIEESNKIKNSLLTQEVAVALDKTRDIAKTVNLDGVDAQQFANLKQHISKEQANAPLAGKQKITGKSASIDL